MLAAVGDDGLVGPAREQLKGLLAVRIQPRAKDIVAEVLELVG